FLLEPFQAELVRAPLYISLDKDVMTAEDALVNWDSGHLTLAEVQDVLAAFIESAQRRLVGMDVIGDWSSVQLRGLGRRVLHWTEHPSWTHTAAQACERNQQTNMALLSTVSRLMGRGKVDAAVANGLALDLPVG